MKRPSIVTGSSFISGALGAIFVLVLVGLGSALVSGVPGASVPFHPLENIAKTLANNTSVDADADGLIDDIDTDVVNSSKVQNNTIEAEDVVLNEICAFSSGGYSNGCPIFPRCQLAFAQVGSGPVSLPPTCGFADATDRSSGSCSIILASKSASTIHFAQAYYTGLIDPSSTGLGPNAWIALVTKRGTDTTLTTLTGSNGNTTSNLILDYASTPGAPTIQLVDDSSAGSETGNTNWYLVDTDPTYNATVWVC